MTDKKYRLYIEKKSSPDGIDTWYIKEQLESLEPVVVCLCNSGVMAQRVYSALMDQIEQNKRDRQDKGE